MRSGGKAYSLVSSIEKQERGTKEINNEKMIKIIFKSNCEIRRLTIHSVGQTEPMKIMVALISTILAQRLTRFSGMEMRNKGRPLFTLKPLQMRLLNKHS